VLSTERCRSSAESGPRLAASSDGDGDARSVGGNDQIAAPAGISVGDRANTADAQLQRPQSNCPGASERDSEIRVSNGSHAAPHDGASRQPADEISQVAQTFPPHKIACDAVSSMPATSSVTLC